MDFTHGVLRFVWKGISYAEFGVAPSTIKERGEGVRIHRYMVRSVVETLQNIAVKAADGRQVHTVIDPFPLFCDLQPCVVKDVTLDDVESRVVFEFSLPPRILVFRTPKCGSFAAIKVHYCAPLHHLNQRKVH
ncbi:hypothetical protein BDN70DRAFT_875933 [Pholiota conissans]|uniref:Uncharacterized protein n=1 Tax=Pholiota conissans TaxID=109636 RepID=A0A9P6D2U6_9AGAR|nr:hypothetical protein BDN70DRAFT_875933 [Pholiota conissans]